MFCFPNVGNVIIFQRAVSFKFCRVQHFQIDHNAPWFPHPPPPPPPPRPHFFHNHCFQLLLGIAVVRREFVENGYEKLGGGGTRCIMVHVKMVNSRAFARIIYEKSKGEISLRPSMGIQNMQAKKVYWCEPSGEQFTNVWGLVASWVSRN